MTARFLFLLFCLASSILIADSLSTTSGDDDLAFLEEAEAKDHPAAPKHGGSGFDDDDIENFDDLEGGDDDALGDEGGDHDHLGYEEPPAVDEKDVVVLKSGNFSDAVEKNRYLMVEFYAPWCGHCKALAPEYAAAATELKGEVVLAKVDATEENDLGQKYDVQGFPTVLFFVDGVHKDYNGPRSKDGIVSWIKKKIGPGIQNITTVEEAEKILKSESRLVVGFFDSLVGSDSNELSAASKLEDDVNFYQTSNPDVAKVFSIEATAKRPSLILLKKENEKISNFDGTFTKTSIAEFVFANKLPLVNIFTRENAPQIFENPIKKQILLFATSNDSKKILTVFEQSAKFFKGKLIFVYVEMDNEDVGKPVAEYFGVSDSPSVLGYTGNEDAKKYIYDGDFTLESFKTFASSFYEDKLKPFFKSDPIPETNDGDVKIVVGDNFDEIVLDESKDVLLEIYAPWCGHCQALEPTYNKLGKHLRGIDSLVIAKMDGTTNEHPRAKSDGYPTIIFYPAGNKSFDPVTFDGDRTVVSFYKFLKQHASIPFKLQRPASPAADSQSKEEEKEKNDDNSRKDEL